ncbi:MAG: AsmA-like C-terminal region-containing protein [Bacteroidales bacterium]
MGVLKKVLVVLLIIAGLIGSVSISVGLFIRKDLTEFVLNELNHFLRIKVEASEIKFHLLSSFPRASVEFSDVKGFAPSDFSASQFSGYGDTVFAFRSVRLDFNLPDLFRKYYSIHSVQINEGTINILIDKDGIPNYLVWKKNNTGTESKFFLELKDVKIRDVFFRYESLRKQVKIENRLSYARVKGDFSASEFTMALRASGQTGVMQIDSLVFPGGISTSAEARIFVKDGTYSIQDGKLEAGKLSLTAEGTMKQGPPLDLDIVVRMKNADMQEILKSMPLAYRDKLWKYSPSGRVTGYVRVCDTVSPSRSPRVEAEYRLEKCRFRIMNDVYMENLAAKLRFSTGAFHNLRSALGHFSETSFSIGKSRFSGSLRLENFVHPSVMLSFKTDADAGELYRFFSSDSAVSCQGRIRGDFFARGTLRNWAAYKRKALADWNYGGSLQLTEGEVFLRKQGIRLTDISGTIKPGREFVVKDMNLVSGPNHFRIQAFIPDFHRWLTSGGMPDLHAQVYSPSLKLTLGSEKNAREPVQESKGLHFPDSIRLHLDFSLDHLQIGKFGADHVTGLASYYPYMLVLRSVNMETMSGKVSGGGAVVQRYNYDFMIRAQGSFNKLDIQQLFSGMNSFGQTFITDQHVRGILDGSADVQAEWDNQFRLKPETVLAGASITISRGELINFEPLMGLSDFIRVEDLRHVYFSTLQNEIYIRDKTVILPAMDIKSSALNISASGEHGFDNNYTYRIRLLLNEVLTGKARRMKKENTEFGIVSPDDAHKMLLHLVIRGDGKDVRVAYDTRSAFSDVKSRLRNEKETLKTILKEEFSRNRSDTSFSSGNKQQDVASPQVEFDESLQPSSEAKEKSFKRQEEKTKFRIELDEELLPDTTKKK